MFNSLIRKFRFTSVAAVFSVLPLCLPVVGQIPGPAVPQLTDAQAQALLQISQSGVQLTSEQTQMLAQYVLRKSQSAAPQQGAPTAGASVAATPAAALADKKMGVVRIGIVMPKMQLGQGPQDPSAGEPMRNILAQYLTGPSIEVTSIGALLPQQIEAEATANRCDYLVYSSLTQKKSGGGLGFLKGASGMAGMIPMLGGASAAMGAVTAAATAATAAQQAASLSSGIRAKSEVVVAFHVKAAGSSSPVLSKSISAKATADGEDIISPLIEQEATAIMAQVRK
ncbi:MAG: hypothetical protein JOY62_08695 [Acidobacteriaceae bacterium]|nr:hypothetical protein [Acidobacteriaceae bacterium]MBV9780039.1 hypothetical protein [Acidobacteriaceae bacterium]